MRKEAKLGIIVGLVLAAIVVVTLVIANSRNTNKGADNVAVANEQTGDNKPINIADEILPPVTTKPSTPVACAAPVEIASDHTTTRPAPTDGLGPRTPPSADTGTGTGTGTASGTGTGTASGTGTGTGADTAHAAAPTGDGETYVIQPGDNLWKIAQDKYHDGSKYTLIEAANPGIDKDHLKLKATIKIPPLNGGVSSSSGTGTGTGAGATSLAGTDTGSDTPSGPVTTAPAAAGETYVVQDGDTLWSIAKKHYGDATKKTLIEKANPGIKDSQLHLKQKLILPPDTSTAVASGATTHPAHASTHASARPARTVAHPRTPTPPGEDPRPIMVE